MFKKSGDSQSIFESLLKSEKKKHFSLDRVQHCDPMDYSLPGSSVCGILWARILEWVAIPFSRGIFLIQGSNLVSHITGKFFTIWATREILLGDMIYWAVLRRSREKESYPHSFLPGFLLWAQVSGCCSRRGGQAAFGQVAKEKEFLSLQSWGLNRSVLMAHNRYFVMVESLSKWEEMVL